MAAPENEKTDLGKGRLSHLAEMRGAGMSITENTASRKINVGRPQ